MTGEKITKNKKTSNIQGSGFDVKIVGALKKDSSIENSEDITEKIIEEYSKDQTTKEIEHYFREELNTIRQNLFTLFGIFASIVTFLLVEVQILKSATSMQALAGLSLILLGAISFFVILIKVILGLKEGFKCKENKAGIIIIAILLVASILFIKFGVCLASKGDNENYGKGMKIEYNEKFYRL